MRNEHPPESLESLREEMVHRQIESRGVCDSRLLEALRRIPRHEFVPGLSRGEAYEDHPLPIGAGQTISQPYMVALTTAGLSLTGKERVLEIGTGSGYQTAILALLAERVYTVERVSELAARAGETFSRLGYGNIEIMVGDGSRGWPEHAPYDGIIVTAGAARVPPTLLEQLGEGGRLVIPVGGGYSQSLAIFRKERGIIKRRDECGCVFVPLIGEYGWKNPGDG